MASREKIGEWLDTFMPHNDSEIAMSLFMDMLETLKNQPGFSLTSQDERILIQIQTLSYEKIKNACLDYLFNFYEKALTDEEIDELISIYQKPVMKKMKTVTHDYRSGLMKLLFNPSNGVIDQCLNNLIKFLESRSKSHLN